MTIGTCSVEKSKPSSNASRAISSKSFIYAPPWSKKPGALSILAPTRRWRCGNINCWYGRIHFCRFFFENPIFVPPRRENRYFLSGNLESKVYDPDNLLAGRIILLVNRDQFSGDGEYSTMRMIQVDM